MCNAVSECKTPNSDQTKTSQSIKEYETVLIHEKKWIFACLCDQNFTPQSVKMHMELKLAAEEAWTL